VRVLPRLALMTRPKLLDSPPMIDLFPLATCLKRLDSSPPELYHNNISVCAQKVRIVLAEKNLSWINHHLSLAKGDQLTAEFKKMNPRGVVPVLVHDGNIIVESSVLCPLVRGEIDCDKRPETGLDVSQKKTEPIEAARARIRRGARRHWHGCECRRDSTFGMAV
jgi:hypothetical protein